MSLSRGESLGDAPRPSREYSLRPLRPSDLDAVGSLLDTALGAGFWEAERDLQEVALVAVSRGVVCGVAAGGLELASVEGLSAPVGHIRLVAVDQKVRRRGVASRLVTQLIEALEARGARSLLAYAWVHGADGTAPLARPLEAAGMRCVRRIEAFYAEATAPECPACGTSPCVCPADVYVRG